MMITKFSWIALSLVTAIAVAVAFAGCRSRRDPAEATQPPDAGVEVDLFDAICDGKRACIDFPDKFPSLFSGGIIGITDCIGADTANLYGTWRMADADSRPFEWKAEVRKGGVFPTMSGVAVSVACLHYSGQHFTYGAIVARDPPGFEWSKFDGDDVFIPLRGEATLGHRFHATATLDERDDASPPRVTVAVREADTGDDASPPGVPVSRGGAGAERGIVSSGEADRQSTVHRGIGRDDRFSWGDSSATVIRVVEPQEGVLGAIGWVEVRLSDAVLDAGS